jgi:hypothetical protein
VGYTREGDAIPSRIRPEEVEGEVPVLLNMVGNGMRPDHEHERPASRLAPSGNPAVDDATPNVALANLDGDTATSIRACCGYRAVVPVLCLRHEGRIVSLEWRHQ